MNNAIKIDRFMELFSGRGGNSYCFDNKTEALVLRFFEIVKKLKPMMKDSPEYKEFWVSAPRGSLDDFREIIGEDEEEEEEIDSIKDWYKLDYPDKVKWYKIQCNTYEIPDWEAPGKKKQYYGIFINDKYIFNINDPQANSFPVDGTELAEWLVKKAEKAVKLVEGGEYNEIIEKELPCKYKYGTILRKDLFDIMPEERKAIDDTVSKSISKSFLKYISKQLSGFKVEEQLGEPFRDITTRDYFEALAVGYDALDYKRRKPFFKETEDERKRYNGTTPREKYSMYADGRADGLENVPLDDHAAFEDWLNNKGPYYEFNGHHPWEVKPSMSSRFSIQFSVINEDDLIPIEEKIRMQKEGKLKARSKNYYFALSGNAYPTYLDVIKMYVAMRDEGIPVYLFGAESIVKRVREEDKIGILPEFENSFSAWYGHSEFSEDVMDFIKLDDVDDEKKRKEVIKKTRWKKPPKVELS